MAREDLNGGGGSAMFFELEIFGRDGWATAHYFALLPSAADGSLLPPPPSGWPVLFFLQGTGEMSHMDWALRFDFFDAEARRDFIIVSPYAPDGKSPVLIEEPSPWGVRVSRFNEDGVMYLLEHAVFSLKHSRGSGFVDESRIYITGYSLGGEAVWNLAGACGRYFAAVSPLACSGHADVICTAQGALNLLHLPLRVFQASAEKPSWKSDRLLQWLGSRLSGSTGPHAQARQVGENFVRVIDYGANRDLWEIELRKPGEEYDPRDWRRNHDVWTTVYSNEQDYRLLAWFKEFRNQSVALVKDLAYDFVLRRPVMPSPCMCFENTCPSQRSGIWCGSADGRCLVGTFPEWQEARPICGCVDEQTLQGNMDLIPRIGDEVLAISGHPLHDACAAKSKASTEPQLTTKILDQKFIEIMASADEGGVRISVKRQFGFSSTCSPFCIETCSECARSGLVGWASGGPTDSSQYCLGCWASWDYSMRQHVGERTVQWSRARGDFTQRVSEWGAVIQCGTCTAVGKCPNSGSQMCTRCDAIRQDWFKREVQLRVSCPGVIGQEFSRLLQLVDQRSRPLTSAADAEGQVLLWHHDGLRCNGTLELCADRRLRWRGGKPHGSWHVDAVGTLVATFGDATPVTHKLQLVNGERLVLVHPRRSPPSFAERPLARLSTDWHQRLEDLQASKESEPLSALIALQSITFKVLQGVENVARWREKVLRYLEERESATDGSVTTRSFSLGVSLPEINRDLKFTDSSEMVNRRKLLGLRTAITLSYDHAGQTYVALRHQRGMVVSTASPGSSSFMLGHMRRRIIGGILSFLEPQRRADCWADVSWIFQRRMRERTLGFDVIERKCDSSIACSSDVDLAAPVTSLLPTVQQSALSSVHRQCGEAGDLLKGPQGKIRSALNRAAPWWEQWHPKGCVPVGHTVVSWNQVAPQAMSMFHASWPKENTEGGSVPMGHTSSSWFRKVTASLD
mmetsp:Transcript_15000/g.40280  ORF Transcript_15000/g.40280 Transcript_15000/m.40280 type:complete len:968 (+) Transcript_15000:40-2943(+)